MKIRALYQFFIACFTLLLFSSDLNAQFLPPGPTTATLDPGQGVSAAVNTGVETVKELKTQKDQISSELNSRLQQLKNFISMQLNNTLIRKKPNEPNIPASRKVANCTVADMTDENSVAKAYEKLFMRYPLDIMDKFPEDQEAVKKAYDNMGKMFVSDSILEMYVTVRSLEDRMIALKSEFDKLSACYVQGKKSNLGINSDTSSLCDGASATDENLGIWMNYHKMNMIYDSMLRVTEELYAIKANYEVARAMQRGLYPMGREIQEAEQAEDQTSEQHSSINAKFTREISSAYAQMFSREASTATSALADVKKQLVATTENTKQVKNTAKEADKYKIIQASPAKIHTRFEGAADQFQDLARMTNLYEQIRLAKNIHNLKQQMPSFKSSFEEADKMRQLHEKALEKLKESEDCVVKYLGNYYANPQNVWLGSGCKYAGNYINCVKNQQVTAQNLKNFTTGDMICEDNPTQICRKFGVNDYASRSGFAGWLVSAYKTAKAEKAIDIQNEEISPALLDTSLPTGLDNMDQLADNMVQEQKSGLSDDIWAKPSKSLEVAESNREANLLSWQIGAEGAKAIGQDMASSSPKWGTVQNTYPLWNDEKFVYAQYLKEKYKNMKSYVRSMDLRHVTVDAAKKISDTLTGDLISGISVASVKTYNGTFLNAIAEKVGSDLEDQAASSLELAQKEVEQKLNQLESTFGRKVQSLESSKKGIYDRLDAHGVELQAHKETYNKLASEVSNAQAQVETQHMALSMLQDRRTKGQKYTGGFEDDAEVGIEFYEDIEANAIKQQDNELIQVDNAREKMDDLKLDLENLEKEKAIASNSYITAAAILEHQNFEKIRNAVADEENASLPMLSKSAYFTKALDGAQAIYKPILLNIVGLADSIDQKVKQEIIAKIDEAYEQIEKMEDTALDPKNYDKLQQIHQNLINSIKNIEAVEVATSLPLGNVKGAISQLFANQIYQTACENNTCLQEDDEYFVGLPAKARDFMMPKKIASAYMAPIREVVHFDTIDYANLVKSDQGLKTTRHEFLNYGQDVPSIWKTILTTGGFVEKDIEVAEILSHDDGAGDQMLRGGSYPCAIGQRVVDVMNGKFYVYQGSAKSACKGIASAVIYSNNKAEIIFSNGDRISANAGQKPDDRTVSELAMFLKYNQGLATSDTVNEIVQYFKQLEESDAPQDDEIKADFYENALFKRNQFGDFLDFVELEMAYQKAMDQLDTQLNETRAKINNELKKIGHELPADFDLADEKTYKNIVQILDEHKNKVVKHANSELAIVVAKNDALKERKDKLKNIIKALEEDKDELVQIDDNTVVDSAFTEKVKRKKADNEVLDRYKEEGQEAFEKQLNSFKEPYCAAY